MKTLSSLFFLFTIVLAGCVYSMTYNNREQDKADAEKVTTKLFEYLKSKNYDATYSLYSDSLWLNTPKQSIKKIYTYSDDKLGNLQSTSIEKWQTKVITGTKPSGEYEFIYKNKYERDTAQVNVVLVKEHDGKIRIIGYHINSQAFLAK
jgi:hypothetical protein